DFENINKRSKVDQHDILISMIGTVGETLLIQDEPLFAIKNIGLFKTSQRPDLKYYVDQYLKTQKIKNYLEARHAGTTQKYLSLTELRKIPLLVPSDDLLLNFNRLVDPFYLTMGLNKKANQN